MYSIFHYLTLSFIILIACSVFAEAEVYRWTDATGKVHFSDQKPKEKADNVTDKVKKQNIDSSTQEHQKMEALFRKENDADREFRRAQSQPNDEHIQRCNEAKEYLRKISGRVQFLDSDGKAVNISEAERRTRAEEMHQVVKDNCSD